jgi:hypothetical protein
VAVTVNPLPAATITPQSSTTFCAGDSVILQANSGTGLTYQWKKGAANIAGATLLNYTAKTGGTYKVVVTSSNSCSKTSAGTLVTVNCRLNDDTIDETKLKVFPNPVNSMVTLRFAANQSENGNIRLTDVAGREVMLEEINIVEGINEYSFKIGNIKSGIYFIKIEASGPEMFAKIIKD